jgi:hypothetical protein
MSAECIILGDLDIIGEAQAERAARVAESHKHLGLITMTGHLTIAGVAVCSGRPPMHLIADGDGDGDETIGSGT